MVRLPTSEDLRDYSFPALVKSTDKQKQAAKDLICKLDLQTGENERVKPSLTFNPALQYQQQVVMQRVVDPTATDLP